MIIPFLTNEQFFLHLQNAIVMQVIIMICMVNFAKRQPTDYDTKYMRRWRVLSGIAWIVLAFSQFFIIEKFSLPIYYYEIYGTTTPSSNIIQTGVSPYLTLYPNVEWGHLTFQQWLLETRIENVLRYISLGLYFILCKPSSVKKWVKVRKFIGYTLLLYFLPATINFHYFSVTEFASIIIMSLLIYFLVRTYKKDAIAPIAPESHIGYDGKSIEDLQPIEPEEKVVLPIDENLKEDDMPKEANRITLRQRLMNLKNSLVKFIKLLCSKLTYKREQGRKKDKREANSSSKSLRWLKDNWKKLTIIISIIIAALIVVVGAYMLYGYYKFEYLPEKRRNEAIEKVINGIQSSSDDAKRIYYSIILQRYPTWQDIEDPLYSVDLQNGECPYELYEYVDEAYQWFESKAYEGNSLCQICLASFYDAEDGVYYVEPNKRRAAYWYEQSAINGFVDAYSFIGLCYRDGEGVSRDLQKAIEWFQKGSEANNPICQYYLGDIYQKGAYVKSGHHYEKIRVYDLDGRRYMNPMQYERVTQGWDQYKQDYYTVYRYLVDDYKCILQPDIEKAKELWRKSAAQGYQRAKEKLEQIY